MVPSWAGLSFPPLSFSTNFLLKVQSVHFCIQIRLRYLHLLCPYLISSRSTVAGPTSLHICTDCAPNPLSLAKVRNWGGVCWGSSQCAPPQCPCLPTLCSGTGLLPWRARKIHPLSPPSEQSPPPPALGPGRDGDTTAGRWSSPPGLLLITPTAGPRAIWGIFLINPQTKELGAGAGILGPVRPPLPPSLPPSIQAGRPAVPPLLGPRAQGRHLHPACPPSLPPPSSMWVL